MPFQFSLNVFTEFSKFSDKNICYYNKRDQTRTVLNPFLNCTKTGDVDGTCKRRQSIILSLVAKLT